MAALSFEWDAHKAARNANIHGVTFTEAVTVFADPFLLTFFDDAHADDEDRFQSIGRSDRNRILLVIHTDRDDTIRIISCRKATSVERTTYEQ